MQRVFRVCELRFQLAQSGTVVRRGALVGGRSLFADMAGVEV